MILFMNNSFNKVTIKTIDNKEYYFHDVEVFINDIDNAWIKIIPNLALNVENGLIKIQNNKNSFYFFIHNSLLFTLENFVEINLKHDFVMYVQNKKYFIKNHKKNNIKKEELKLQKLKVINSLENNFFNQWKINQKIKFIFEAKLKNYFYLVEEENEI